MEITDEESAVLGSFATVPNAGEHLGHGVFLENLDVTYSFNSVDLDLELFQAADGDTDGDGDVDGDDIQNILAANTFPRRSAADWTSGDFTGDGLCDGDDIQAILAASLFGSGPYAGTIGQGFGGVGLAEDLTFTDTVEGAAGVYQGQVAVPEPATLIMVLAGAVVLLLSAIRRRRHGIGDPS